MACLDFSPAAARKFFEEGVKTLEGLFIRRCASQVFRYFFKVALLLTIYIDACSAKTQCSFIVDITLNEHTLYFLLYF